ncbi:adenylylsulfate kinase [Catenulispora sp. GAS73]|uniref:adenylyl-sulfate kinase n=1 Tax=Catenulispora sp. GAS73 TaxID=3156269 RepID=UPI0035140B4B
MPNPTVHNHCPAAVRGVTIWLTGLPSSGKTTLANELAARIAANGHRSQVLDGDELRTHLSPDLGFSKEDRDTNVRRIGYVAQLLAQHGVKVLVPAIAPYAATRAAVRARHAEQGTLYFEVHVAAPVEVCAGRDVKGLYAKQAAGVISNLTGVGDPYEIPVAPDLSVPTHRQSVSESVDAVHTFLVQRGVV